MARLIGLRIKNYRSVQGPLIIGFPSDCPVVLLGENNAGKSNIVKALDLLLGTFWPTNHDPEPHEYYDRDPARTIQIDAQFSEDDPLGGRYSQIRWEYGPDRDRPFYEGAPGQGGHQWGWINKADRDSCVCVVLEADRNLNYQLSYRSKFTLLSRLMHKFHKALLQDDATRIELEALFENVKEKFYEIPEFADFNAELRDQLSDFLTSMTHSLEVDFEAYNPTNFFHALRLQAQQGGYARTLEELGTGEEQVLALSFAYAFAQAFHGGILLVVEEPEAHLHPLAQEWLARRLTDMCRGGLQLLMTTHSPQFLEIMNLEGLVLITKDVEGTHATQLSRSELRESCVEQGAPAELVTDENILPFYRVAATSTILEGLFAKAVVLVEGPTEEMALPIYLQRMGLDHARVGLAIVPVHGKGSLARWKRFFTAYGIPVYVIFDNDAGDDGNATKRHDVLTALGIGEADVRDAIIEEDDWVIEDHYSVFGQDFETTLRAWFPEYEALENEVREEGLSGKPLIAREVAETLTMNGQDGWDRMSELATRLKGLLAEELGGEDHEGQLGS